MCSHFYEKNVTVTNKHCKMFVIYTLKTCLLTLEYMLLLLKCSKTKSFLNFHKVLSVSFPEIVDGVLFVPARAPYCLAPSQRYISFLG